MKAFSSNKISMIVLGLAAAVGIAALLAGCTSTPPSPVVAVPKPVGETPSLEVDDLGNVTGTSWMRAPQHAPEVMADIERTVRSASPYPAPVRLGQVTYTDTWLWHKSGTFQLDALTEGQM